MIRPVGTGHGLSVSPCWTVIARSGTGTADAGPHHGPSGGLTQVDDPPEPYDIEVRSDSTIDAGRGRPNR